MKEIIYIVEGKNDVARIKQVLPLAKAISVGGSAVNDEIVDLILKLEKDYEIVIATDPDYAGSKIRNYLVAKLNNPSHIFVKAEIAKNSNNTKIGIEHLSDEDIKKCFKEPIRVNNIVSDLTTNLLYEYKLIGHKDSSKVRNKLTNHLKIGSANGKTLLERLKMIGINEKDLLAILKQLG